MSLPVISVWNTSSGASTKISCAQRFWLRGMGTPAQEQVSMMRLTVTEFRTFFKSLTCSSNTSSSRFSSSSLLLLYTCTKAVNDPTLAGRCLDIWGTKVSMTDLFRWFRLQTESIMAYSCRITACVQGCSEATEASATSKLSSDSSMMDMAMDRMPISLMMSWFSCVAFSEVVNSSCSNLHSDMIVLTAISSSFLKSSMMLSRLALRKITSSSCTTAPPSCSASSCCSIRPT
mmetsp:Transcript_17700/g.40025  ORF Transcript_17700/g.40025 Transcript_17700/m.40025 type:complete len:232 (-) Transcript_17700:16-711(-)